MPTKKTMDDKPAPKKGRGYIAYSTQSKNQGNVPGKKFNVIGVPGATIPPEPWEIRQQQTPQAGAADASRGNADVQPGTSQDDGKPAKIVYRVPTRDGKRLVQQVAVPGATVPPGYANNQTHAEEQGEDARPDGKPMARPTYSSTGSLMLPTKKRKADGTIVDADKAFNDYVSTLPENQRDSKNFNVRRYWELNGRPANFDEAVNRGMFTMNDEDKMWHAGTVAYNQAADEYEFMKSPDHPTIGMEVDAYNNSPEMAEFRQNYYLDQSTTPWKYRRREGTVRKTNTADRHQRTGVTTDGGNKVATQETEPQLDSYDKMLEYMRANQVADADAAGRARRRELMAAIGDGISAVSSLYQTTKGAPVTYTPGADMSKVMRDRYDRMIAQRKADSDKYLNYLRVQNAKEQNEATKAYHQQQLEETKRYHDAAIDRDEERTEAIRMKNFITAGADAAYNEAYNDAVTNQGMSEDQAEAYARQAYDTKVSELFNEWSERETQAAADKHAESKKKQENYQARTDKTKATPAKSTSKSKKGKGGSTKSKKKKANPMNS